jgi:uncharacterized protein
MLTRRGFLRAIGATALSGGAYACGIEPFWLETVRTEIALEGLDPAFDGYVVAQISDLHVGSGVPLPYLRRAVEAVNAAKPDLVVVTGDILDGCAANGAAEDAAGILSALRPRDAVMAVLGNHDTGAFHPDRPVDEAAVKRLKGALAAVSVDLLFNEERTLERGAGRLRIAGFGDLWSDGFDARAFRAARGEAVRSHARRPGADPVLRIAVLPCAAQGADVRPPPHRRYAGLREPGPRLQPPDPPPRPPRTHTVPPGTEYTPRRTQVVVGRRVAPADCGL